ncbi:hypothetical protein [Streptomyces venezuelae]|uniref:hypothetical protein n=1 Tax=Streptomyces venezuelae TaxID=54571 RepID=UPI0036656B78
MPTASGSGRPEIELPKSFEVDLNDGREELRAGYAAVIEANLDSEAMTYYRCVLFYCVDEGKVTGTPEGTDSRLHYRMRLGRTEQGVWKTPTGETERNAC